MTLEDAAQLLRAFQLNEWSLDRRITKGGNQGTKEDRWAVTYGLGRPQGHSGRIGPRT